MTGSLPTVVGLCLAALCVTVVAMDNRNQPHTEEKAWQLEEDTPTNRRLNQVGQAVLGRISQKTEVIAQLIQGRMSLLAAVSWFRHYHETAATQTQGLIEELPGETLDEKYCSQVFLWVQQALRDASTSQKAEVISRLECERAAARQQGNGSFLLPGS